MGQKVLVLFHIFYTNLIDDYLFYINNISKSNYDYDLYVSICSDVITTDIIKKLKSFKSDIIITQCPNRGADIGGLFSILRNNVIKINEYYAWLFIHTKKSEQWGTLNSLIWRASILNDILINGELISFCIENIKDNKYGIVASNRNIKKINSSFTDNELKQFNKLCTIYDIKNWENYYFVIGSMFWGNIKILEDLIKSSITINDFEPVFNHGGLLQHGFERIFSCLSYKNNMEILGINLNTDNKNYHRTFNVLPQKIYSNFKTFNINNMYYPLDNEITLEKNKLFKKFYFNKK